MGQLLSVFHIYLAPSKEICGNFYSFVENFTHALYEITETFGRLVFLSDGI